MTFSALYHLHRLSHRACLRRPQVRSDTTGELIYKDTMASAVAVHRSSVTLCRSQQALTPFPSWSPAPASK